MQEKTPDAKYLHKVNHAISGRGRRRGTKFM
jgi:hypothetical protein